MLGSHLDLGTPVADHPLNYGLTEWWVGRPEWLQPSSWQPLIDRPRRALAGRGTVSDTAMYGGPFPGMRAAGTYNLAGGGGYNVSATLASGELSPANTFTWEFYFYFRNPGNFQSLMAGGASGAAYVRVGNTNVIQLVKSGVALITNGNAALTAGRWYHLVVTVDSGGTWRLYINGVLDVTSGSGNSVTATTSFIVNDEETSTLVSQSQVAGVAVWNARVLTDGEAAGRADQWRRGLPDLLRRWSRRAWLFGGGASGGSPSTGDLAVTLGAVTASAAGAVAVVGAAGPTLGTLTLTAAGVAAVTGSASPTLGSLSLSGAGAVAVAGSASPLGAVTLDAAGNVTVTGGAGVALGDVSLSAAGAVAVAGTAGLTLGAVALTADGVLAVTGTTDTTLDSLTLAGGAAVAVTGGAAVQLGALTVAVPAPPGGTFRLILSAWPRVLAGQALAWGRTLTATLALWPRTWRYAVPATLNPPQLAKSVSDDRDYLFDFSGAPELADGDTISSAAVTADDGITVGAAAKTTQERDKIPAGKGVQVRISGGTAGEVYDLACLATLASGRVLVVPARLAVLADHR